MVPAASHGTLSTHNELTGVHIDLEPLRFDSTYIHVNPGDIFKPVTNYSLPPVQPPRGRQGRLAL